MVKTDRKILKRKPFSDHPRDDYLETVLAKVDWGCHGYVTWNYSKDDKGYFGGHYFETLDEAEQDYERR